MRKLRKAEVERMKASRKRGKMARQADGLMPLYERLGFPISESWQQRLYSDPSPYESPITGGPYWGMSGGGY